MTTLDQLAAAAAAIAAVLAAVFALLRWAARCALALVDEWRRVQRAIAASTRETARLAEVMREQVGTLIVREAEDRRQIRALTAWQAAHDRQHEQGGWKRWTG